MTQDPETLWTVQQRLDQYLQYAARAPGEREILKISFQFLERGQDGDIIEMEGFLSRQSPLEGGLERSDF